METEEEPPLGQMMTTRPTTSPWLILDRFIVHRSSHLCRPPDAATSSAASHDCIGRPILAYLDVAAPPAVSRLHLRWPSGRPPPIRRMMEPAAAIAAHGDCILFKACAPFADPHFDPHAASFFPVDYFVYSPAPPSLTRLPPCFVGVDRQRDDRYFRPYRLQQQRVMLDRNMGVLRHGGDGEFTVADLTQRDHDGVDLCALHHAPHRAGGDHHHQWSVRPLRVPPGAEAAGLDLSSFDSDAVVPVAGRFLAWVDYYQGMLLVDVLHGAADPELRFVPMPAEALLSRRWYYDEGVPDPVRCVGVTAAGAVKLVCVITPDRLCSPAAFTIATWTLADIDGGVWEKDGNANSTMDDSEFFGLCCGGGDVAAKMSREQPPSFPTVSLVDPDVVCFLLEEEHGGVVWMVEVNMRTKVLLSRSVYLDEEEARRNPFDGLRNFISYLTTTS